MLHRLPLLPLSYYVIETKIPHCVNDNIATMYNVSLDEFYIRIYNSAFFCGHCNNILFV